MFARRARRRVNGAARLKSAPPMQTSPHRLTPLTVLMLVVPPLLWAANAVVGRLVRELVSPLTLNFVRWVIAFALLLPLAWPVLRRASPLWAHWKNYTMLGLLGIGLYNAFQYLGAADVEPHQHHAGRLQPAAVDAGHGRAVLQRAHQRTADCGRAAVDGGRADGAEPWPMAIADGAAAGAGRPLHDRGHHRLGLLQLDARAHARAAGRAARLGRVSAGAAGVRRRVVGRAGGRRMGADPKRRISRPAGR